jgi:hypothetical protein
MIMLKDRSKSILEEIEKRKAVPIPRWYFVLQRFGFWVLAAISVLTGSIAMSTAIYVFIDNDFIEDHDYIHLFLAERPLIAEIISSIPYIWLATLALFTLVAYFGFRHTKTGYRYATTKVIAGALLTSLLLSVGFNTIDVGKYIHRYLIENVHVYNKLVYANEHRWTQTEKGLLGGKVIQYQKDKHVLVLRDFNKNIWNVDMTNTEVRSGTRIVPGKYLKITGIVTGKQTFHALTVQGWSKRYHKHRVSVPKIVPMPTVPDTLAH